MMATWPLFAFLYFFLLSPGQTVALLSRRAKCAMECYSKCANSGTPKAVYCNCPATVESEATEACASISEDLLTEKTVERQIESESGYKDIQTIWLRVEPVPGAFIYIFEFSVQSAERPIWIFAGASSAPQITISVPDPCRDYQFRVLVVFRLAAASEERLLAFRPKPIPAQFPPFVVPKESIHMDRPKQSSDGQTLHVSVSWQHPAGYGDAFIYGYTPPTAYPISCRTPEDRLSQPRLELVQGGARLHLALPIDVLQERCRLYMEVRMLPRCVRIDPFDIQISVELDCSKFPSLRYCRRDQSPQCTDVVDLWGKENGRAIVVWQRPQLPAASGQQSAAAAGGDQPLFYIVRWGPAQSEGSSSPLMTRRLVQSQEIRVPGNITVAELAPEPGVQYGLQICAFYAERGATNAGGSGSSSNSRESPFHIVPVIPFTCTPCTSAAGGGGGEGGGRGKCIDCSKIEEGKGQQQQQPQLQQQNGSSSSASTFSHLALQPKPFEDPGGHVSNRSSVHFISGDTVFLDVFGAKVSIPSEGMTESVHRETTSPWKLAISSSTEGWIRQQEGAPFLQKHAKTHQANAPISLDLEGDEEEENERMKTTAETTATEDSSNACTTPLDDQFGKPTAEEEGDKMEENMSTASESGLASSTDAATADESSTSHESSTSSTAVEKSGWSWDDEGKLGGKRRSGGREGTEARRAQPKMAPDEAVGEQQEKEDNGDSLSLPIPNNLDNGTAEANNNVSPLVPDINSTSKSNSQLMAYQQRSLVVSRHELHAEEEAESEATSQQHFTGRTATTTTAAAEANKPQQVSSTTTSSMATKKDDVGDEEEKQQQQQQLANGASTKKAVPSSSSPSPPAGTSHRQQLPPLPAGIVGIEELTTLVSLLDEEGHGHGEETPSPSAFGIRTVDPQKLMLAGPVFFLLGLMAGLGLFCSAFIRRRRRRHSSPLLPSYGTSLNPTRKFVHIPDHHRLKLGGQPPPPVRSVLAARTCAAAAMPIGTPIGQPTPSAATTASAQSSGSTGSSSGCSTGATLESRLLLIGNKKQQTAQHQSQQQYHQQQMQDHHQSFFADNTARFFMAPGNIGTGHVKNVHF